MESPQLPTSPTYTQGPVKSSSSSAKFTDDVTSLTSFNPFFEEDEHDQSSYTLVSSLFSRVKNSFASPLASTVGAASGTTAITNSSGVANTNNDAKSRPNERATQNVSAANVSPRIAVEKPRPFKIAGSSEPTLALSVEPALSVAPTVNFEHDGSAPKANYFFSPTSEQPDGGMFGTAIPGFPIQDDTRSIHTNASLKRSLSVSKVIRRIRGEGELLSLIGIFWPIEYCSKVCQGITGWTTKTAGNVTIARASSRHGAESIIVGFAVSAMNTT